MDRVVATQRPSGLPRGGWARVIAISGAASITYAIGLSGVRRPWQLAVTMAVACQFLHLALLRAHNRERIAGVRLWPLIAQTVALAASLWIVFIVATPAGTLSVARVFVAAAFAVGLTSLVEFVIARGSLGS